MIYQLNQLEKHLYWYKAKLNFIYDGDSVTAFELDFGFGLTQIVKRGDSKGIRLYGIDTPELNTEKGKLIRDYIKPLEGETVFLRSYKDRSGKYGRYLFELFVPCRKLSNVIEVSGYVNLNQHLLDQGMADEMIY